MTEVNEFHVSVSKEETLLSYLGVILDNKLHFSDKSSDRSGIASDCRLVFHSFAFPPGPAGYRHRWLHKQKYGGRSDRPKYIAALAWTTEHGYIGAALLVGDHISFYVKPAFRKQGIAATMLSQVIEQYKGAIFKEDLINFGEARRQLRVMKKLGIRSA